MDGRISFNEVQPSDSVVMHFSDERECIGALVRRDGETFLIRYRRRYKTQMLRALGRMAQDESSSFDWDDAAMMAMVIRNAG